MIETPAPMTAAPRVAVDPLTDVLRLVHVASALFVQGEFSAPWALLCPSPEALVRMLQPGARQLLLFHLVAEGTCEIALMEGEAVLARAGEVVLLPYAHAHRMAFPPHTPPVPIASLLPSPPWPAVPVLRHGGGGSLTQVLCGYFGCDDLLFNPLLRALPPLVHLRPDGNAAAWLQASLRYALDELERDASGAAPLLQRLAEALLVDCLRQLATRMPPGQRGWLAALRDPIVGRALSLLHADPARAWDVATLARRAGSSRSALGARFTELLGESPMRYLAHWRVQLAAQALTGAHTPVSVIAEQVGYESQAAFSRAFKRHLGVSPARWRAGPDVAAAPLEKQN